MTAHSSILAWEILPPRGAWEAIVHAVAKSQTQTRGVRIHAGNSAKDSSACVLVGFGRCGDNILNSRNAEIAITALARNDPSLIITGNGMV